MNYLARIRKALVPIAISGVLAGLAVLGVGESMTVAEAVTVLVTAFATWLVPNRE